MKPRGDAVSTRRPEKKRAGVFLKGAVIGLVLTAVCIIGGLTVLALPNSRFHYELPWFESAERGFRIFTQLLLAFTVLCKIASKAFESD